jgi:DNA (cytosine-5)-methyltransferase 1
MKHMGLFEGIGGFSLAARWMGWETLAWCEWNEFGQKVLRHHFPEAEGFGDITKTDFKKYANRIDVITGGFPCQPYSNAGKRKGKEDDRHLWPSMLRAIREVQPRYVVGENVRGLTNWNGGLVFDEVQADLEAEGYEVLPFLLPAVGVNAPHRRDRIWFIAKNTNQNGRTHNERESESSIGRFGNACAGDNERIQADNGQVKKNVTDTNGNGLHKCNSDNEVNTGEGRINALNDINKGNIGSGGFNKFQNFPTQSPICGGNDGLPTRLDGITFSKWRTESIKAYGNAIVPQIAYEIFKAIEATD